MQHPLFAQFFAVNAQLGEIFSQKISFRRIRLHLAKWACWDNCAEVSKNAKRLFNAVCGILNSLFTELLVWCRERGGHIWGDWRLSLPLHLFAWLTRITYTAPCMKYLLANRIFILFPFAYNNMIVIAWHHPGNWWGNVPLDRLLPHLLSWGTRGTKASIVYYFPLVFTRCWKVWIFRGGVFGCPHPY